MRGDELRGRRDDRSESLRVWSEVEYNEILQAPMQTKYKYNCFRGQTQITPLISAALNDRMNIASFLMERQANIEAINKVRLLITHFEAISLIPIIVRMRNRRYLSL